MHEASMNDRPRPDRPAAVACAHGRTPISRRDGSGRRGQVIVVRNDNLFGWGLSVTVTFDDAVIAHLRAGEHVAFRAAPGLHTVGVADRGISVAVEREPHVLLPDQRGGLAGRLRDRTAGSGPRRGVGRQNEADLLTTGRRLARADTKLPTEGATCRLQRRRSADRIYPLATLSRSIFSTSSGESLARMSRNWSR
ncbi:MAG: hypothetical protein MZU95_03425 [Desulfomicrobium escambiense]|nr:hypothetical protein [Desulfomicrobium escambiense]